jgi:hypothetical protein
MVKTGFGAILHKRFDCPMPAMCGCRIGRFEKLERVESGGPCDREATPRDGLRKLQSARGGGSIHPSDDSVTSAASELTGGYIANLVHEYGSYRIRLPEEFTESTAAL